MLRITVLGSGSRGNAILIDGTDGAVLVDAGFGPRSLVRMRMTSVSPMMKILPSPILPVRAALVIVAMAFSTCSSATATSIFTFGRKSTVNSLPR